VASLADIAKAIESRFTGTVKETVSEGKLPHVVVEAARIREICEYLKSDGELAFDFLSAIAGVDKGEQLEVVYLLYSYSKHHSLTVKARVPRAEPVIQSVAFVWPAADWHERETFDLIGIRFDGHPDLRRILLPPDWVGYPLRKDYKYPVSYEGITLRRDEEDWSDPGPEELYK
jgi:NADH-quinone oxidoreductase subunit C